MYDPLPTGTDGPELNPQRPTAGLDPVTLEALSEMLLTSGGHARRTMREVARFLAGFPELSVPQEAIPRFTWEQLERQLIFLAGTPQRQAMVASRVAEMRKDANHKPEEMILQEILIAAWILLDEEPQASLEEGDAAV